MTLPARDGFQHNSRVFSSIFPIPSKIHTTPTPLATPDTGFTAPGQPFGGPNAGHDAQPLDPAAREVKRGLAWSTATRFLSFYKPSQQLAPEVIEAISYLVVEDEVLQHGHNKTSLIEWYAVEIRKRYFAELHPILIRFWDSEIQRESARQALEETQARLQSLQDAALKPLSDFVLPIIFIAGVPKPSAEEPQVSIARIEAKFKRDLHAVVVHSLPASHVSSALELYLFDGACRVFRPFMGAGSVKSQTRETPFEVQNQILELCSGLQRVGLGQERGQRAFAHAMDRLIKQLISSQYMQVDWDGRTSVADRLRGWIKYAFSPFVEAVLGCFNEDSGLHASEADRVTSATEIKAWQEMAIWRLGKARVRHLYDYVLRWDRSLGAILDLKDFVSTPAARSYLTLAFSQDISRRLLHPAAPTTHILDFYVFTIRTFNELDPRGVLLDRVARPIRRHLKERDDTAKIIIGSLLANIQDGQGNRVRPAADISMEIAVEMLKPFPSKLLEFDHDLDWANMEWTPDPIDAGPEYKKSKSEDVTSYLLTLYDREDFISELRSMFGSHLLYTKDTELAKEIRLLELFKLRLGEDKLQACEVMLRDVIESKHMDAEINSRIRGEVVQEFYGGEEIPELHAQILSSFFWPALREDVFDIPLHISTIQDYYERAFEGVKNMRKLHWLPALGHATIELQLEDRAITVEAQTWQASIIYAFQDVDGIPGVPVSRTVQELEEMLRMDEALVRSGLNFWVGQMVLEETSADTFTVLETLDSDKGARDAAAAAAAAEAQARATASAVKSQEDLLLENMAVYSQFILGMLTNQGTMPLAKIHMMLKMVVPGGFPFGPDHVKVLLAKMVEEGKLTGAGDVYGVKKS